MTLQRALNRPLAMALLLGCGADPPSSAPPPPPPVSPLFDRIVFARYHPASCTPCDLAIWSIAPDGTDLRRVVDDLQWPETPAVAPNGLSLVFDDAGILFLADVGGVGKRAIHTGFLVNHRPSWTPDGEWIVFSASNSLDGLGAQVFKIRPTGADRQSLVSDPRYSALDPTLSRDGHHLAFLAQDSTRRLTWMVVRDLLTGLDRVVSDSAFTGEDPRWAPDDASLLFLDLDPFEPARSAFWRLDLITLAYTYFTASEGNRIADYSPDGTTLVFGTGDLWLADSSGQHRRILLADSGRHFGATWTPSAQ